jgi:hypothetical protein
MDNTELAALFQHVTTPHVADACLRTGIAVRCAPCDVRALSASRCRIAGGAVEE